MAGRYFDQLAHTPATLRRIVDCVHPEHLDEKTDPERFTLREAVAHLADFEDIFLDRFRLAYEQPGATITPYDEGARAVEKHYSTRDVQHELDVFENRRRDTMTFLNELNEEGWRRCFVHPELGTLTIREYAWSILGHDLYHLEHATRYLRLG